MFVKKAGTLTILILIAFALCSVLQSVRAEALGNIKILSHSSFYDGLNTLWIVGEVENTGDMATQFTKVTATYYNSSNNVVAVETGYTELDVILPGRKSPFSIMLLQSSGSLQVYNYSLTVSWDNYAAGKPLALQILSNSSRIDEMGYMHVLGEIKNTGSLTARFTKAIATFYDANGTVVGEAWSYTEPSDITSNQTAAFDIELIYTQQVTKVASYSLTAESMDYALIPEYNLTIIPLIILLSLTLTLSR
ncbi:MAG: FxLYD domain-containing protein, partial [Candidatus Bathyarchaeales archaeon]